MADNYDNLDWVAAAASRYELATGEQSVVADRVHALHEQIAAHRKSTRWKTRALAGDRVRWYELPEEVEET